jgi:hypothetical protein
VKSPAVFLLLLSFIFVPSLNGGIISANPNFPPQSDFGSAPGVVYTVTSPGFANGWTMSDLRIFDVRNVVLSGCQPLLPFCVETDGFSTGSFPLGSFTLSAKINGAPFLEDGPMQFITVTHVRTFLGPELMLDVMTIDIGWMRAYPTGGPVPLMIWVNPNGTMVASNIGGGLFDLTLNLTARTALRTEVGGFQEVAGPEIPLGFVPEPGFLGIVGLVLVIAVGWRKWFQAEAPALRHRG